MARPKPDLFLSECPSRQLLAVIGTKWSLLILHALSEGDLRTGELRRRVGGISQKMLTQTLRELQDIGLLARRDHGEVPPRVEYQLTRMGHSLAGAVRTLDDWVLGHFDAMMKGGG